MLHRVLISLVVLAIFGSALSNAQDKWYDTGHQRIAQGAILHLPTPLRTFFEQNANIIVTTAGQEPPGTHYIDIDYYPEFFAGTLPHNKSALIALYGQTTVEDNGTVPWTIGTYTTTLTSAMFNAHTVTAWLTLRTTAGQLGHYIGDAHNPLHLTKNYNGQLSGNTGIHSRYEGGMIDRHLTDLTIVAAPEQCVYYSNMVDAVFAEIDVNYWYVDDILSADTTARGSPPTYGTAYYNTMWNLTGGFTHTLFQDASEMLASAWYTAWVNAGRPNPPIVSTGDVNCDGVISFADINPFVLALSSQSSYQTQYPTCYWLNADINGDSTVSFADINPFVALLAGK